MEQDTQPEGAPVAEGQKLDIDGLVSTNKRLLEESKRNKALAQEYKKTLEERESKEAQEANDWKRQFELMQKKNEELNGDLKTTKQKVLISSLHQKAQKLAPDVYDIEDLLNQPKFSSKLAEAIDRETLEVNEDAFKGYLDDVLKAKPHLRRPAASVSVDTTIPNGTASTKSAVKDVKSMSRDELDTYIKSLGQMKL